MEGDRRESEWRKSWGGERWEVGCALAAGLCGISVAFESYR